MTRLPECRFCYKCVFDKEKQIYLCFKDRENPKKINGHQSNKECFQSEILVDSTIGKG